MTFHPKICPASSVADNPKSRTAPGAHPKAVADEDSLASLRSCLAGTSSELRAETSQETAYMPLVAPPTSPGLEIVTLAAAHPCVLTVVDPRTAPIGPGGSRPPLTTPLLSISKSESVSETIPNFLRP